MFLFALDSVPLGQDFLGQTFRQVLLNLRNLLIEREVFAGWGGGRRFEGLPALTAEFVSRKIF
jgi:hypothetical protein